jgi:proline iminopeptidase
MQKTTKGAGLDVYLTMWGPTEFHCTGNLKGFDLTKDLHKIKVPVLLACGKYDEATPVTTRYYASLFQNARVKVFTKSAHSAYLEEKEKYIETIARFLREV